MKTGVRAIVAIGFLGCATLGLVPIGCASRIGPVRATQSAGSVGHPNLPDIFVEKAKDCVAEYGQQMDPGRVVLNSTLEVNEDRDKVGVTIDGIPERAPDFGACLRNVLRDMPIAEDPFHEGVGTLKFHIEHASDSQDALIRFIEAIPGVPIVESELVLEAEGYTVVLPVTVKVVAKAETIIDGDKAILAKIGQMALDSVGYEEIMRHAELVGWVKWVPIKKAQLAGSKQFLADGPLPANVDAIVKEAFKQVMTKAAPAALIASQADSPAPGPGDLVGVGILAVGLVAVGGIAAYKIITSPGPISIALPAPTAAPTPQRPPPPPPPPPPKETCEANSELNKIIRCDDPRIRSYPYKSETDAFKSIKVAGIRMEESKKKARGGPCKDQGGWHTRVKSGKDYIASIMGCNCCDDSSGKAVQKESATVQYH